MKVTGFRNKKRVKDKTLPPSHSSNLSYKSANSDGRRENASEFR
jgi:hypothetical protein